MNGYEYEQACADYLRRKGFRDVQVTQASRDQGADIIAVHRKQRYAVQCKYYATPVGNKAVQEVYAAATFYECDRAVVMTNNTFTKGAIELAESLGVELMPGIEPAGRRFGPAEILIVLLTLAAVGLIAYIAVKPDWPNAPEPLKPETLGTKDSAYYIASGLVILGGMLFFLRAYGWGMAAYAAAAASGFVLVGIQDNWKALYPIVGIFGMLLCLFRLLCSRRYRVREATFAVAEEAIEPPAGASENEPADGAAASTQQGAEERLPEEGMYLLGELVQVAEQRLREADDPQERECLGEIVDRTYAFLAEQRENS